MTCALIGDGIARALLPFFPNCRYYSRIVPNVDYLIISLSTQNMATLRNVRKQAKGRVCWVLPINQRAIDAIMTLVREYKDEAVRFVPAADHVHPKSYKGLADIIKVGNKREIGEQS